MKDENMNTPEEAAFRAGWDAGCAVDAAAPDMKPVPAKYRVYTESYRDGYERGYDRQRMRAASRAGSVAAFRKDAPPPGTETIPLQHAAHAAVYRGFYEQAYSVRLREAERTDAKNAGYDDALRTEGEMGDVPPKYEAHADAYMYGYEVGKAYCEGYEAALYFAVEDLDAAEDMEEMGAYVDACMGDMRAGWGARAAEDNDTAT